MSHRSSCRSRMYRFRCERGETLLSLIVSLALGAVILSTAMSGYLQISERSYDHSIIERTNEQAKATLDMMAADIRMLGSGMPLGQSAFPVGDATLGTPTLPILTNASATYISLRLNELGNSTVLTADFDPSASSTINVFSVMDVEIGDTIYISNASVGGTAGLHAVVTAVGANSFTVTNKVYTPGATFKIGSLAARVTLLTYNSPGADTGITRNPETGAVLISPGSTFSLTYYDLTGTALAVPLTEAVIKNNLAAVDLSVTVDSPAPLRDGSTYSSSVSQRIALRNLNLSR